MKNILALLPRPSRYIGIEEGSVHKKDETLSLKIGLAFPDMYEVGMSYLGQKILYAIVNETPHWQAERIFTPCTEAGEILKKYKAQLCTLESKTPMKELDVVGFSITHELCYTNILYMLDLAGIPLKAADRISDEVVGKKWPLIIAGGGCTLAAEPMADFFDLMMLGEGEEMLPELLLLVEECQNKGLNRQEFLKKARKISGVYVPEFFPWDKKSKKISPLYDDYTEIVRRVVPDMNTVPYPAKQPIAFGAVHNRLALEIARGCTRSCRFCQAGAIYRPARERSVDKLADLLKSCLADTGFDDVSFLSLSTGDYSALKELFMNTVDYCAKEQVSVSLPSLRVGSIDDSIMGRMAGIRRTGTTLAPEAGSQRLRDVINKGISEEEIILHIQKLFEHGWQHVKLYFMIGLPTETDDDLQSIIDLCIKARDAAGPGIKRMQITASISPFVPKPHTPFQWHEQDSRQEIHRKIGFLLNAIKGHKRIKLRWHDPDMSALEGVFSRGGRELGSVVESAYHKGDRFTCWNESFSLDPWLSALEEHGFTMEEFQRGRDINEELPWDHLKSGLSKDFFVREWERSKKEVTVKDCRFNACLQCGACDTKAGASLLDKTPRVVTPGLKDKMPQDLEPIKILDEDNYFLEADYEYHNIVINTSRDQESHTVKLDEHGRVILRDYTKPGAPHVEGPPEDVQKGKKRRPPKLAEHLIRKEAQYKLTYQRFDAAAYISQLEIQSIVERAFRRGKMPLSFSQGFRPAPLFSFGRALPVGVETEDEWFTVVMSQKINTEEIAQCFKELPLGMELVKVEEIELNAKIRPEKTEKYQLTMLDSEKSEAFHKAMTKVQEAQEIIWWREGKKQTREINARKYFQSIEKTDDSYFITFDWEKGYLSPLALCLATLEAVGYLVELIDIKLKKIKSA